MTDPYRTPAEIAADIPRRPFDYAFWRPFVMGMKAMAVLTFLGFKIVEGCATHVPPMHDVPRTPLPHVEAPPPRFRAFAPAEITIRPNGTWLCNDQPIATVDDAGVCHPVPGTQKSPATAR